MSDRAKLLEKQQQEWPHMRALAREGNPLATMCLHCYGRHAPPRDDLCKIPVKAGDGA